MTTPRNLIEPDRLALQRPEYLFPVIRWLARLLLPLLLRTPISANAVTLAALAMGIASAVFIAQGTQHWTVIGAGLLVLAYVLDNCDGDIARFKGQVSRFGGLLDTFVDWAMHSALFAALGYGVWAIDGNPLWIWLGWAAMLGGTLNYVIGLARDLRGEPSGSDDSPDTPGPSGILDWLVFVFRELTRADFCFIVLALALLDLTWVLLPAAAIGAQAYWLTSLYGKARHWHV